MKVWVWIGAFVVVPATVVGAMLMSDDVVLPLEHHAYLPCEDAAGTLVEDGTSVSWERRCVQIPNMGPPVWDCVGVPEDFEGPRWCPPWAEHDELLWTVTFLDQTVTQCAEAPPHPAFDAYLGEARGCVHLRTLMAWHPGTACAGLKQTFPDAGGYYQERFPALFCFSVDYEASAWSTDSAGNATFTTSLSADRGELGHIDAEHERITCTWSDGGLAAGDEGGCEVASAAKAQGKMWLPHVAAHIFEPGTGGDHVLFARLEFEATGRDPVVIEASATAEFFILGGG